MQVLKFGGSSVANAQNINQVVTIVKNAHKTDKTAVVVSALGGCTDALIHITELASSGEIAWQDELTKLKERHLTLIDELINTSYRENVLAIIDPLLDEIENVVRSVFFLQEVSPYIIERITGFGEILSSVIIAEKFTSLGLECKWLDAREMILAEKNGGHYTVNEHETYARIEEAFRINKQTLYLIPGFVASDEEGHPVTLGRGGSDYSAALIAAALDARRLEVWTDVDGIMTADPRIVGEAKTIEHLSYKEALELSHFGAKVICPTAIQPAIQRNIPIYIKNTFRPTSVGTWIEKNPPHLPDNIKGISGSSKIALLSMEGSGMIGIPGYSGRLFAALAAQEVDIILITQASSVHTMLLAIAEADAEKAKKEADRTFSVEIEQGKIQPIKIEKGFSIISLVGNDMKNQSGTAARLFEGIASRGISIKAIAHGSSESNVSAIVSSDDFNEAVYAVHSEFFEAKTKDLHLFIAGYGTVGKALVGLIERRADEITEELGVRLKIVAIANSRLLLTDPEGLEHSDIQEQLTQAKLSDGQERPDLVGYMLALRLKNSVFIDCTSDFAISAAYARILSAGIKIVTCNKIANTLEMDFYKNLQSISQKNGVSFRYETNVGAALPIISSIKQIISSGDKIHRLEGAMSGSLNYIFNNYDSQISFGAMIKQAWEKGYTEPDPRTDLQGLDLKRKALIVAREIGLDLEIEDIKTSHFLSEDYFNGTVNEFYDRLEKDESTFKSLYDEADKKNEKLFFGFTLENDEVTVELRSVSADHPFYAAKDTDNVIAIYSDFYPNGLMIQGAGAGAWQTASGLFANIIG